MQRLRHRPDYFKWRGDEYDFHRHQDGASLPCLDRHTPKEQEWPLHSGRVITPTGEEVRSIIWQVHGIQVGGEFAPREEPPAPPAAPPEPVIVEVEKLIDNPDHLAEIERLRAENEALRAGPAAVEEPAPEDGIPEAFRGFMLDGESAEKFTERMRRRWQALKHLQIDGTKPTNARALPDMTPEESDELADLEARNAKSKWLD